jgi:3-hydroxyacyl-[acyl-carrier-protein] dehydratase
MLVKFKKACRLRPTATVIELEKDVNYPVRSRPDSLMPSRISHQQKRVAVSRGWNVGWQSGNGRRLHARLLLGRSRLPRKTREQCAHRKEQSHAAKNPSFRFHEILPTRNLSVVARTVYPEDALQYNLRLERNRMTDTTQTSEVQARDGSEAPKTAMNIGDIFGILPHRYPFLLIDRVVELVRMKSIVALKNVTITEPFFQGHFPGQPIMPGVLIVEAIAQAGGLLLLTEVPNREQMLMVFTGIEKARFRRPVVPGDQLRIEVVVKAWRITAARLEGKAYVDGKVAAEATVTCRLVPRNAGPETSDGASDDPKENL